MRSNGFQLPSAHWVVLDIPHHKAGRISCSSRIQPSAGIRHLLPSVQLSLEKPPVSSEPNQVRHCPNAVSRAGQDTGASVRSTEKLTVKLWEETPSGQARSLLIMEVRGDHISNSTTLIIPPAVVYFWTADEQVLNEVVATDGRQEEQQCIWLV